MRVKEDWEILVDELMNDGSPTIEEELVLHFANKRVIITQQEECLYMSS